MGAFLHCLHTEWKNGGGRKLDRLIIRILTDEPSFQKTDAISSYSINMLAKSVEVHEKICEDVCWIEERSDYIIEHLFFFINSEFKNYISKQCSNYNSLLHDTSIDTNAWG